MLDIGGREHAVTGAGIFVRGGVCLKLLGARLPLRGGIFDASLEPPMLFFLSNFHPVLNKNDSGVNDMLFGNGTEFEEFLMLSRAAKTHDVFDTSAVVPTSIENYYLPGRGEMRHITLDVHLRFFAVGRRRQRNQTKNPWTHPLGDRANGATLSSGIASFKDDDNAEPSVLDPVLKFAQFALETPHFLLVFLAF